MEGIGQFLKFHSGVLDKYNIEMIDGLGGKIRSSSSLTGLKQLK